MIRQCLVEETNKNKDIIGLHSKIAQFQFFFFVTLRCQFVIHMTQCHLGNVFSHITHFPSPVFCTEYITPMCGKNKISHQRFGRKTNCVVEYCNTIEFFWYFMKKQSFGLTGQILNQRNVYRSVHKYHYFSNMVWSLNQCCATPDFGLQ